MARWLITCAFLLHLLGVSHAAHAEIFVICNPGISLDVDEIVDVFLGGKQFSSGTRLVPVDNTALQEAFLARVLHMSATRYATLWIKKAFRDGTRQPQIREGDAAILEFVRKTPGGVGYVHSSPSGVKVVTRFSGKEP